MEKLLTRDEFRNAVFIRDNYKCVICKNLGQDAHHIIERRLFENGGYYLNNGATVCNSCHLKCESTEISVEEIREKAGIKSLILPLHFYKDDKIDKWGNYILPNGSRLKGELFYDESVQKVISPFLHLFSKYIKHPRTPHLPWSESCSDDDIQVSSLDCLNGQEVVVTEKMDGENTTYYNDYCHARSIDSKNHISRNRSKAFWATICGDIPETYRIVVENMFAVHSIKYESLESYIYGLFVWDNHNCLSYDESKEWFTLLGISLPKELYRGIFNEQIIKNIKIDSNISEGYVVRVTNNFKYSQFKKSVFKYVRKNHVQTKHWSNMIIIPNNIKMP